MENTIKKRWTRETTERFLENLYLAVFSVFIAWSFLATTKFEIIWWEDFYQDIRIVLFLVVIARIAYMRNFERKEILFIGILGVIFLFDRNRTGYIELENMLLLILGAKDIPAKKIVKTYLCVMGSLLIYTIFSALTGRVENLIYYQEGRRARMALGIGYPTDFSAYIFYGILSYIFIRGKKLRYIELGIIAVMGGVVYWVTDARLNTICILMTAAIFVYNKWRNDAAKRKEKVYEMCPWWSMLLALSPILCAAFMIVGSCLFPTENKVIALLDRVLNYRFYQGYKAIDIYGFHPWGQDIQLVGFGGTTEVPKHYFFLDSSYLNIGMQYGVLFLGSVLLIWILMSFRAREMKDWTMLWIIAIIAVQCMIEHHMIEPAYNPFFFIILADMVTRKEK